MPAGTAGMSIGAVLDLLRPEFPDVTISKIRFLEAEGLVTPARTGSGSYRSYTVEDLERFGPTLILDHKERDGERVLVWSQ